MYYILKYGIVGIGRRYYLISMIVGSKVVMFYYISSIKFKYRFWKLIEDSFFRGIIKY